MAVPRVVGLMRTGSGTWRGSPTRVRSWMGTVSPGSMSASRFHVHSPVARVDDLDSVGQRSLDPVAALGDDPASRFLAVDEELGRLARALIGRHGDIEVLPALSVELPELTSLASPRSVVTKIYR